MWKWITETVDLETLTTQVVGYLPDVGAALVLIAVFWIVLVVARRATDASLKRMHVPEGVRNILKRFMKYGIVILALLTIANQLGINVASLIAGLGVAGLAISLAAQDTVTNLIAGITLAIDRPFKRGDRIRLGDLNAEVTDLRLRTTVLTTFDNETMVIPNKQFANERIVNYTLTERIRIRVGIGIAYGAEIDAAREALLSALDGDERILDDPAPDVIVKELAGSSVNLELRFWVTDPTKLFPMRAEYSEKCKKALDAADIEIPFPHLQLLLEKSEGLDQLTAG
jgi:small conductance mechanosensitive channel